MTHSSNPICNFAYEQNGLFDIDKNSSNLKSSLTASLHIETNLECDVTSGYQKDMFIKKEQVSPAIVEEKIDVQHKKTTLLAKHDMACEIITPDLKSEPEFVCEDEENTNSVRNHKVVNEALKSNTLTFKNEITDSNGSIISDGTGAKNGSDNSFIKEEVSNESDDSEESENSDEEMDSRMIYDVNESFDDEKSASENEVDSNDAEAVCNIDKKRKKIKGSRKGEHDRPFKCLTCGNLFKYELSFEKHTLSHSNKGSDPVRKFECQICCKKYMKKQHLQRHLLSHSHREKFACAHCNKSYLDKNDLKKHMACNHVIRECSICGMTFESYSELRRHHLIHKKSEREKLAVVCDICNKTFLQQRYLKRHLRVHAKLTPFACDVCNKSFLYKFLLQEHFRSHTGERPFSCETCDRKFSTKSNLIRHERNHIKTRTCRKCCGEFEDEEQFKAHKESCTLKYECGKCGWVCDKLSNLRRHVKTHTKYSSTDMDSSTKSDIESENIFVRIVENCS